MYSRLNYLALPLTIVLFFTSFSSYAVKYRYPTSISTLSGAGTYCIGATPTDLSFTIGNSTCDNGPAGYVNTTVNWYYNLTNSTSVPGATLVQTNNSTSATANYTFTPPTGTAGSRYYFAVITSTALSCAPSTSQTTSNTQLVTVNPATNYTSTAGGGNWTATTSWVGGTVPSCGDNVTITGPVTVNANVDIGDVTIQNGATLTADNAITITGTFTIDNGGTYVHNFSDDPGATSFAGTESFGTSSTIKITDWNSAANPVGQYATQFGNIEFAVAAYTAWDQDGTFAPNKIKGNVTITDLQLNFDDGTGATTALTIDGSVTTNGTGGVIFAQGADRNVTLVTGSFNHSGSGLTAGMYLTVGVFDWTVNGDLTTSDDFTGIQGGGAEIATCNVTVTGDVNITGGLFDWNRGIDGDVDLDVTGDINVSGAPGWVRFNDANSGSVTVDCDNFNISGGVDNDLQKGSGAVSITCAGAFTHSGATTETHLLDGTIADGNLTFNANSVSFNDGTLYGVYLGDGDISLTTTGALNMYDGTFMVVRGGDGDVTMNIGGTFNQDAGDFRGNYDSGGSGTNGLYTATYGAIDFDGGLFMGYYGIRSTGGTMTHSVTGSMDINFTATTDIFRITGLTSASANAALDWDVGGSLIISGVAGEFTSHVESGDEDIDITGNVSISGGVNSLNGALAASLTMDHNVTLDIGGNLTISGGETTFSKESGTLNAGTGNMVDGNMTISGGTLYLKNDDGTGNVLVGGNFTQMGGSFYFHNNAANSTADVIATTITGNFSHIGGTLNFEDNTSSTATHTLTLNGGSCTLGGTGVITRANAGTGTVFAEIYYNETGTMTFSRTSTTHQIDQTRQIINSGCVLDASGSSNYMQLAANNAADDVVPPTTVMMDINGVLDLGTTQVIGRSESATQRPTSLYVQNGAELRTGIAAGLYDGTTNAALVDLTRNSTNSNNTINSMNWYLGESSTVTYNGSVNQVTTGIYPVNLTSATNSNVSLGTTAGYKYAYLKINHQGTIGTNYVNPSASNVFVRTQLELLRGEYRLDGSGTGYMIVIENSATIGINKTGADGDAYIRSETNSATNPSIVRWYVEATTGDHVFPFGHSAGASNYIPFTFTVNSGGAVGAYVDLSTRATDDGSVANNKENMPRTTGVTHMYDPTLLQDGSTEAVVDRWWQIDVSTNYNADLEFTYRGVENTLDAVYQTGLLGAQRWSGSTWISPLGSSSAVTSGTGTVTVTGATAFSPWVLSSLAAPLPVDLVSFDANCTGEDVLVEWVTANEINNDFFTVERSEDGEEFNAIGKVNGVGNSSIGQSYTFIDEAPIGNAFYRLTQTDFNGVSETFEPVFVRNCSEGAFSLYPNPTSGEVLLEIPERMNGKLSLKLVDITGKVVYHEEEIIADQVNRKSLDFTSLSKGTYMLLVQRGESVDNLKIILK